MESLSPSSFRNFSLNFKPISEPKLPSPPHLPRRDDALARVVLEPLLLLAPPALLQRLEQVLFRSRKHGRLHFVQPLFRAAFGNHRGRKRQVLAVGGEDPGRLRVAAALRARGVHLQLLDALEALLEVRLREGNRWGQERVSLAGSGV